jgi:hypothetical protein
MKTRHPIAALAALTLLPAFAFAQLPGVPGTPPAPPAPAVQPVPAVPPVPPVHGDHGHHSERPKVPVTWLGVETSELPNVVAEQLGMPKGFGLVVDYVVPNGPAAAAGVQANDILKMLNDQILTETDQLTKLIRSYPEGTTITLTVLRKGVETRLQAQLAKREVRQRQGMMPHGFNFKWKDGKEFGELTDEMKELHKELGNMNLGDVARISAEQRQQMQEAGRAAREAAREATREARERARDARESARDAARQFRFQTDSNGGLKTTRIDMNKAQIVYHDNAGELKIQSVGGKKLLTAKDPQGRTVFSGPVESKEEIDKMPADVRQRFDKLEQKDLPNLAPDTRVESTTGNDPAAAAEAAADAAADAAAEALDDDDDDSDTPAVFQVNSTSSCRPPFRRLMVRTILS